MSITLTLVLLLSISASYGNMTKAQPLWEMLGVPTGPINAPPTIQISSLSQNQTFYSPTVSLNFSVITPHSWVRNDGPAYPPNDTHIWGNITSVSFLLDDNLPQNLTVENMNVPYFGNSSQNLNFSAPLGLTKGPHSIQVFVSGYTYYCLNPLDSVIIPLQLASIPVEANTTINFYVAQTTTSTPTPTPTSSPIGSLVSDFAVLITAVIILAVVIISVLLFRRHRKTIT